MSGLAQGDRSNAGSLKAFFVAEGFAGASLHRRFGNHLFVSSLIIRDALP
jgi:hypothetical protein